MIWKKQNGTEILEILGEGLTSRVYKAIRKHSVLNVQQVVALKVLNSQDSIQSLKNEIELLLTVDSPYCVKLLGWEETTKGLALVLEYLDGVTLEELCRYRSLNIKESDEIIFQIQEGLKELHKKGITHGDLGPKNIFITNSGQVKIIDFGFSSREQKHCEYGTPNCVALEVWRGELLTPKSDLFSLGLLRETLLNGTQGNDDLKGWRLRAEALLNTNSLLVENPYCREFLDLKSSDDQIGRLARYVQDMQSWRNQNQPTMKLQSESHSLQIRTNRWVAVLIAIFASVSVSAVEPVTRGALAVKHYNVDVRSHEWVSTQLFKKTNGKEMLYQQGYAPVQFHYLPEGEYVLRWTSQLKSGMMKIHLVNHQKILIEVQKE